jgi:UDP-N-acetylmuramoyl-L-alanyl-D-glutamate--2,6-diaminopimelate ligase
LKVDNNILSLIGCLKVIGILPGSINDIAIDSRKVIEGGAFIALQGETVDGNSFIGKAIEQKAVFIITDKHPDYIANEVCYVLVNNAAYAAGKLASIFYGDISLRLPIIGITGTNGKTTVATTLYQLFTTLGFTCGLVSTVQNIIGTTVEPSTHTTPDAIALNKLFKKMYDADCEYIFMEVSSHALQQYRVAGVRFTGAVFTNITQDHLDYHKTFDAYIKAKKILFDELDDNAFAIINADDKRGNIMAQNCEARIYDYSLKLPAAYKGKILENGLHGLLMHVNNTEAHFRMIGEFNAYNILAVYAVAEQLGIQKQQILETLSNTKGAEGRFEVLLSPKHTLTAIVDYAHTPDAVNNVLSTIKRINQNEHDVITVLGCGGDRDKGKRPLMAAAACEHSTLAIFTADNPRHENPMDIIKDMQQELTSAHKRKCLVIPERKEAIKAAVGQAKEGSIVLVAGKGHEKYQEIGNERFPFDDKLVVQEMFELFDR